MITSFHRLFLLALLTYEINHLFSSELIVHLRTLSSPSLSTCIKRKSVNLKIWGVSPVYSNRIQPMNMGIAGCKSYRFLELSSRLWRCLICFTWCSLWFLYCSSQWEHDIIANLMLTSVLKRPYFIMYS